MPSPETRAQIAAELDGLDADQAAGLPGVKGRFIREEPDR